jgi:hypothetical protein
MHWGRRTRAVRARLPRGLWAPAPAADDTCPVSTEGGTRRVQLVREGGERRGRGAGEVEAEAEAEAAEEAGKAALAEAEAELENEAEADSQGDAQPYSEEETEDDEAPPAPPLVLSGHAASLTSY